MSEVASTAGPGGGGAGRRLAAFFFRHPRAGLGGLLAGPLGVFAIAYLGSLAVLFVAAFWRLDPFTAEVVRDFSLDNFRLLWESEVYREIALRTLGVAAAVTLIDAVVEERFNQQSTLARTTILPLATWQLMARSIFAHENGGDHQFEHRGAGPADTHRLPSELVPSVGVLGNVTGHRLCPLA